MSDSNTPASGRDAAVGQQPAVQSSAADAALGGASSGATLAGTLEAWWTRLPRLVLTWALAFDALWLFIYVIGVRFFSKSPDAAFLMSLEREGNPSTWWYGSQQLLVALVFLCLATRLFDSVDRIRRFRALFTMSALGFGFISLDEVGQIHEMGSRLIVLYRPIGKFLEDFEHHVFHVKHRVHGGGVWIVVYSVIGVLVLIWLIPQLIRAFREWPREVLLVGAGFIVFAISAVVLQVYGYFTKVGTFKHTAYVFVSQGLKMSGISVCLYGALLVLSAGAIALTRSLATPPAE